MRIALQLRMTLQARPNPERIQCPHHQGTPYVSYGGLIAIFGTSAALAVRRAAARQPLSLTDLALLGIATHKLTRLIATDRATSVLRKPVTEQCDSAGESLQERPAGDGMQRALGELVTCPYCLGPWVASALLGAYSTAPRSVRPALMLLGTVAVSDLLHHVTERISG